MLDTAIVYDIETIKNVFTVKAMSLFGDFEAVWEISQYRDDRRQLLEFFNHLSRTQTAMIGYNNIHFDYPVIHYLWSNPTATYQQLYVKAQEIITSTDRFGQTIWASDRFAPQIDLFKIHHFDNRAKSTSLKTLQINMRSESVEDMPVEHDQDLTEEQIEQLLIPYNTHDVEETKKFAMFSLNAIEFRAGLIEQFGVDVLNWNDTKIGEKMIIWRLGDDVCYDRSRGFREMRRTCRSEIPIEKIIFPYISFKHSEFNRILDYMKNQTLKSDDFKGDEDGVPTIKTKGVFKDLKASVGGIDYHYGVGGIHGSVDRKRVVEGGGYIIRDIDVAALYPSIAIKNELYPEHLGTRFIKIYSELPKERKRWQDLKGKKCSEANSIKLAQNGAYGKSNSQYSPLYDPQFTMSITVNGQLLLSMLIEELVEIPTLQVIQANTDGITYHIQETYEPLAAEVCREWERLTQLTLEDTDYSAMYIRDVNNYIAVGKDGSVKLKGAYWTPDPLNFHESIATSQPPAWHKNFSNVVSIRAAVAHMVHGVDIEQFIRFTTNPFDFCCAVKIKRSDNLLWGSKQIQRNTRFYVSTDGFEMVKEMPPGGPTGQPKKANGVSDGFYEQVMSENGGQWDERVCTKNKSRYEIRQSAVMAGYKVSVCNNISDFRFDNVNYDWYIAEARKLVI